MHTNYTDLESAHTSQTSYKDLEKRCSESEERLKKMWSGEVMGVFSTLGVFAEKLPAVDGKMTFQKKNTRICV